MTRTVIMMLDSFGGGAASDAAKFGDVGSDTLGHIAKACFEGNANIGREGPLKLPNLARLVLGHAAMESTGAFA
nr:phosphopentomutase [Shewanella shenzhenensis]